MEKYRTGYCIKITKHTVIKETAHRVTFKKEYLQWGKTEIQFKEETENKSSHYHQWHDSFEDAKNHLLEKQKQRITAAENSIKESKEKIEKILNLEES